MKEAWALFILCTIVAANPVMKYSFCPPSSDAQCQPTIFGSNSPLEFGNITAGVYFYQKGGKERLSVSCTFHEPLHWVLAANDNARVIATSSNVTMYGSRLLYSYHIHFTKAKSGLIRCESYDNPDQAAEIYIAQRNQIHDFYKVDHTLVGFFPKANLRRDGHYIVPCFMSKFDTISDASRIRLQKMKRSAFLVPNLTPECFSCFPHAQHYQTNCITNCPYGISRTVWNNSGRLLGVNKTGNQWLDCVEDPECAFQTLMNAPKLEISDCNGDGAITCSDHFSALSSYTIICRPSRSKANFKTIEACITNNFARLLNSTEADYDPRVGFRLKTEEKDDDAVYVCTSETSRVYLSPYNPSRRIEAEFRAVDNNMNGTLTGIACVVPKKWTMEVLSMEFLACSTLFDCELQLQTIQGKVLFRKFNHIVSGEPIRNTSSRSFGKTIRNPQRSGVVHCAASWTFDAGYIEELKYFFTGLDSKLYFTSDSLPAEAVISLTRVQTNGLETSNEFEIQVECTVATFIVFPNFEFLLEYLNGTSRKIKPQSTSNRKTTGHSKKECQRLTVSIPDEAVSIRCRAPLRNSKNHVQAILVIEPPSLGVDSNLSPKYGNAVILTVASGLLLLLSVTCVIYAVRKHKKSKDGRLLTPEEINAFFIGNTVLATGSSNEVNVDSIGFPECYRIPPEDIIINTQDVLGEGEFGRCVKGRLRDRDVAVKTAKASTDVQAFKEFMREVKILAYLGKHENVVEFLGAVVNQLRERICLAVVELSPCGDLLSYLRKRDPENPSNVNLYENVPHGPCEDTKLEIKQLSYFCEQIAAGMEFVVDRRVIHGDLAARNVLVFPDHVVKITDFGLSRKLYTASNYKKKEGTPLPWRWMALESLKYMEYSPMTDMWAYGVTAWEIFSMGQSPFGGVIYSLEFVDAIDGGLRLQCPKNAPEEIFQFISLTWDRVPSDRPSFEDAKNFFRRTSVESCQGHVS